jgi:superoxide reductase
MHIRAAPRDVPHSGKNSQKSRFEDWQKILIIRCLLGGGELMDMNLGGMIYTYDGAAGEALGKRESHTPRIDAPATVKQGETFEIKLMVGPHPNTSEHSIRWIALFLEEDGRAFNPIMIAKSSFAPGYGQPEVVFKVSLQKGGTLHAMEYCNLHGLWSGKKAIKLV